MFTGWCPLAKLLPLLSGISPLKGFLAHAEFCALGSERSLSYAELTVLSMSLRFQMRASSGSGTKCGMVFGLSNAVLRLPEFCHHTRGSVLRNSS